jgi:hypothetical protein
MRDVENTLHELVHELGTKYQRIIGAKLRCRLHPADYAQLLRSVREPWVVESGLGSDLLRFQSKFGVVEFDVHPGYVRGVVSLMAPDVMDPAGVNPISANAKLYEICDECTEQKENDDLSIQLAKCKHEQCMAMLCDDCADDHEQKVHETRAQRGERLRKERVERIASLKSADMNDTDFAEKMKQRRAERRGREMIEEEDDA